MFEMSVIGDQNDEELGSISTTDSIAADEGASATLPPMSRAVMKNGEKSVKIGGVGFHEQVGLEVSSTRRKTGTNRATSVRAVAAVKAAAKKKPPASFRVVVLLIPFLLVIFGIRYRHDQIVGKDEDDDHSSSSYSSYGDSKYSEEGNSYGESSYESSYEDGHVGTVFVLAESIDPQETSLCFVAIIGATIILDFLIECLNDLCEHAGKVYSSLAQILFQELMTLGVIAFAIFLMNAEGFFWNKTHLFHEIEYTHIVLFYLGLGLIVQGFALAIVNKDIKTLWKFSAAQTLNEMMGQIEKTRQGFLGQWKVENGWAEVNRHLDIHLIRITFLDIMNLPATFAYNEYVNCELDNICLRVASNNWTSWSVLIVFITVAARLHPDGLFMGTDYYGYRNFMICSIAMILTNVVLFVVIYIQEVQLLAKLGSTGNLENEFDLVQAKWPSSEGWNDIHSLLRGLEDRIEENKEESRNRNSLLNKKSGAKLDAKSDEEDAATKKATVRLSAVGRRIKQMGSRIKSGDKLMAMGIDPKLYDRFQTYFMVGLRMANLMQAFYIALIFAHWGWYAPTAALAFLELLPILFIYIFLTPRIIRRYATILSLGKPNPTALSQTIVYMEHNEESLHQVAELIVNSSGENETIDDVFREWDTNHDGVLSFKELSEAMAANSMHLQSERLQAFWRNIDIDSGGSISMAEFSRALNPYVRLVTLENMANAEMREGDTDSDLEEDGGFLGDSSRERKLNRPEKPLLGVSDGSRSRLSPNSDLGTTI